MPKVARQPPKPARAGKAAPKSPATASPRLTKTAEKSVKAVAKSAEPVIEVEEAPEVSRSWTQGGLPARRSMGSDRFRDVMCRSCGKRPGRPTAIIGQLTATELCEACAALRKERIRANRASQRGYRL